MKKTAMRILICEESRFIRGLISKKLKAAGYNTISEAAQPKVAVGLFKREKPNVVFIGIALHDKKPGLAALKDIKVFDSKAKVILVVTDVQKSIGEEGKNYGAVGYLTKPVETEKLLAMLKVVN